jgi:hypothetical protein
MNRISFLVAISQIIYINFPIFDAIDDLFLNILNVLTLSTSFYLDLVRSYYLHFVLIHLLRFFISGLVAIIAIACITFSRGNHPCFVNGIVICILFLTFCLSLVLLELGFVFFKFRLKRLIHTLSLIFLTLYHLLLFSYFNLFYLLLFLLCCYLL